MDLFTIILFFVYTFGLGFTATSFLKNSPHLLERNFMRLGIGLSVFVILGMLLNLLRIPLDWKIFLVVSLAYPLYYLITKRKGFKGFTIKKSDLFALVALLFCLFTIYMHAQGAFSYVWLEDGDPWIHASGVKAIAQEKTAFLPIETTAHIRYVDPYPPGYDLLMGILYQTSHEMIWTLKFFNILFIALGILFFYFFAKEFTQHRGKALFASFVLMLVPAYLSHFIWAHSLVMTLIFPFFYSLLQARHDKKWYYLSALCLGSIILVQFTQAVKIIVLFVLFAAVYGFYDRKHLKYYLAVLFGALLLSGVLWWGPERIRYGDDFLSVLSGRAGGTLSVESGRLGTPYMGVLGSATRMYYFNDFFIAKGQGQINSPVGWGWTIFILVVLGFVCLAASFKASLWGKENANRLTSVLWFIFTFAGLYGGTVFFLSLFSFRFWMLNAIVVALIAAEGMYFILRKRSAPIKWALLAIVIVGIIFSAGIPKYEFNTSEWFPQQETVQVTVGPDGQVTGYKFKETYQFIKDLPVDTKVFYLCHHSKIGDHEMIAFDKYSCPWCVDHLEFRQQAFNESGWTLTPEEAHAWLKEKEYEYLVLEDVCTQTLRGGLINTYGTPKDIATEIGLNSTNPFVTNFVNSPLFSPAKMIQNSIVLKVN